MLNKVFIRRVADNAMKAYKDKSGKNGVAKADVIRIVMQYGGDMDDVHDAMVECVKRIAPQIAETDKVNCRILH